MSFIKVQDDDKNSYIINSDKITFIKVEPKHSSADKVCIYMSDGLRINIDKDHCDHISKAVSDIYAGGSSKDVLEFINVWLDE